MNRSQLTPGRNLDPTNGTFRAGLFPCYFDAQALRLEKRLPLSEIFTHTQDRQACASSKHPTNRKATPPIRGYQTRKGIVHPKLLAS
jgi:hypothetical protein